MQAATTTTTTTTTKPARANKPAKAHTGKGAQAPKPASIAAQAASAAATAAQAAPAAAMATPRPFAGYSAPKGAPQLPRACPQVICLGVKVPRLATAHTQAAWAAITGVLAQHNGKAPAQAVLAALAAGNHTSFFGYALRSGWLAGVVA